jgi:hypothetical protein
MSVVSLDAGKGASMGGIETENIDLSQASFWKSSPAGLRQCLGV